MAWLSPPGEPAGVGEEAAVRVFVALKMKGSVSLGELSGRSGNAAAGAASGGGWVTPMLSTFLQS